MRCCFSHFLILRRNRLPIVASHVSFGGVVGYTVLIKWTISVLGGRGKLFIFRTTSSVFFLSFNTNNTDVTEIELLKGC